MECYKVLDIHNKYQIPKSTLYLKFKQEEYQQYISLDNNGTKVINQKGLALLLEELQDTSKPVQQEVQLDTHLYERIITDKDKEIEHLKSMVESLNARLEQALDLNKNNQVLLLERKEAIEEKKLIEKESKGFWKKLFK